MAESAPITITEVSRLAHGDLLITFSDGTVVLFHADYLYRMRNEENNLEVVDPFE